MMKVTLILLLIAIIFSANALEKREKNTCGELECVGKGDECGNIEAGSSYYSKACESSDHRCAYDFVNSNFGKCAARVGANQTCFTDEDCNFGYSCRIVVLPSSSGSSSSTIRSCQFITKTNSPGQYCYTGESCAYSESSSSMTVYTPCLTPQICKFTADGQPCNIDYQCNSYTDSTCSISGRCASRTYLAEGNPCNLGGATPAITLSCEPNFLTCIPNSPNATSATCRRHFSQAEGLGCENDYHCKEGYCRDKENFNTFGTCVKYEKTPTLDKKCINGDYCSKGNTESCVCDNADTSYCRVTKKDEDFSTKAEKAYNCIEMNRAKCGDVKEERSQKCLLDACKSSYCDYHKEAKEAYTINPFYFVDINSNCLVRQACDAASLFASLSISLFSVAFAVMIFQ